MALPLSLSNNFVWLLRLNTNIQTISDSGNKVFNCLTSLFPRAQNTASDEKNVEVADTPIQSRETESTKKDLILSCIACSSLLVMFFYAPTDEIMRRLELLIGALIMIYSITLIIQMPEDLKKLKQQVLGIKKEMQLDIQAEGMKGISTYCKKKITECLTQCKNAPKETLIRTLKACVKTLIKGICLYIASPMLLEVGKFFILLLLMPVFFCGMMLAYLIVHMAVLVVYFIALGVVTLVSCIGLTPLLLIAISMNIVNRVSEDLIWSRIGLGSSLSVTQNNKPPIFSWKGLCYDPYKDGSFLSGLKIVVNISLIVSLFVIGIHAGGGIFEYYNTVA